MSQSVFFRVVVHLCQGSQRRIESEDQVHPFLQRRLLVLAIHARRIGGLHCLSHVRLMANGGGQNHLPAHQDHGLRFDVELHGVFFQVCIDSALQLPPAEHLVSLEQCKRLFFAQLGQCLRRVPQVW